jgi:hypothetical protein
MVEAKEGFYYKLKGRLFGLLCEKEKNGAWEKFLDTILIELYGLSKIEKTINYWPLIGKVSELRYLEYEYFRKTIFECMNIIEEMIKSE